MPHKLTELVLDEISLVDDPASAGAQVVLAKRYDAETKIILKESDMKYDKKRMEGLMAEKAMTEDEAMAFMDKEAADKEEATVKQVAALTKSVATLTTALEATGAVVKNADGDVSIEKRADDDYVEVGGEKILKSSVPAAVLAQITKQAGQLDELTKSADIVRLDKRAATDIPHFTGSANEQRALLKAVDGISDEAVRKGVEGALKAASKLLSKAFAELGSRETEQDGSAMAALDKMAAEYAVAHDVTHAAAFSKVSATGEGAKLFAKRNAN